MVIYFMILKGLFLNLKYSNPISSIGSIQAYMHYLTKTITINAVFDKWKSLYLYILLDPITMRSMGKVNCLYVGPEAPCKISETKLTENKDVLCCALRVTSLLNLNQVRAGPTFEMYSCHFLRDVEHKRPP